MTDWPRIYCIEKNFLDTLEYIIRIIFAIDKGKTYMIKLFDVYDMLALKCMFTTDYKYNLFYIALFLFSLIIHISTKQFS